jgi:hypothetical protein
VLIQRTRLGLAMEAQCRRPASHQAVVSSGTSEWKSRPPSKLDSAYPKGRSTFLWFGAVVPGTRPPKSIVGRECEERVL